MGGGRGCSKVVSREVGGLGGTGGGIEGSPADLYICSLGGRAGASYESRCWELEYEEPDSPDLCGTVG
jgi:hypothetical protein